MEEQRAQQIRKSKIDEVLIKSNCVKMAAPVWLHPSAAHSVDESFSDITEAQEQSWRNHGYALVDGLLPAELVLSAEKEMREHFQGELEDECRKRKDFGGLEYPTQLSSLNELILHPNLIKVASKLLQTDDIRMTQADAWGKYFSAESTSNGDNRDQRVHIDGWNHMLVVPAEWRSPASVAMIVYLSEVTECGGGTALVARNGDDDPLYSEGAFLRTPGAGPLPWINDRERAEGWLAENAPDVAEFRKGLYAREGLAHFHRGTVLLYRHDAWHRGTALTVPGASRFVVNLSYRRADAEWFQHWNQGWARSMYTPAMTMERIVAGASLLQRNVLGFPKPGHPYWTERTIKGVLGRYGHLGFDAKPYFDAMKFKTD
jgi:hypothetical protein